MAGSTTQEAQYGHGVGVTELLTGADGEFAEHVAHVRFDGAWLMSN